jgi:hypothetical protein
VHASHAHMLLASFEAMAQAKGMDKLIDGE